jgi:hypothetical protein
MFSMSESSFDVVVAGGGVAGVAAALSAARRGARVALLERTRILGGTVAHCLIHTLGGLYDASGGYLNGGTCIELAERLFRADHGTGKRKIGRVWTLGASPEVFREVVESWIWEEKNITLFLGVENVAVDRREGAIRSASFAVEGRRTSLQARSLVDATGNAEVIASVDRELLVEPPHRALGGLIFRIGNIRSEDLLFPRNLRASQKMRRAAEEGILPEEFSRAWIDRGIQADEAYVKIAIPLEGGRAQHLRDYPGTDAIRDLLLSFLRGLPEFSSAKILQTGKVGFRDGGIFLGEYRLTADDVRRGRKFPDAACRCAWPMEFWDPRKGVELEYLAADDFYEVPLRSLKVRGIENLWGAGKCISADPLAQASTRVAGCCWAMGEAVGKALLENGPEQK